MGIFGKLFNKPPTKPQQSAEELKAAKEKLIKDRQDEQMNAKGEDMMTREQNRASVAREEHEASKKELGFEGNITDATAK